MTTNISARKRKYLEYLKSEEWLKTRCDAIEYADHKCERCGSRRYLQVHHLSYDNLGCEEPGDIIVLCSKCHMLEHGLIKKPSKRKYNKPFKATLPVLRKMLMAKFSIKLKGCRGWRGLARKTADLHGESWSGGNGGAKAYVKRKLMRRSSKKKKAIKQKEPKQPTEQTPCPDCGAPLFFSETVIACACGYRKEI